MDAILGPFLITNMNPQYSLHRLWIWRLSIICLSSLILLKCNNPFPSALAFVSTYQRQRQQQTRPTVLIPSMFTGIVEEMGKVVSVETRDDMILWDGSTGTGTELVVQAHTVLDGAYLG
jgi:cellulose synthase/poly-beta-1,6-N-acetylglucosamine synthase-like glycosyltransferase